MSDSEPEGVEEWRKHKPYGGAIKRRKIDFIPGSSAPASSSNTPKPSAADISQLYLSLVLPKAPAAGKPETTTTTTSPKADLSTTSDEAPHSDSASRNPDELNYPICTVCNAPIVDEAKHPHTTAHQYSLPHSIPPHHYNRSSKGLKYLMDQGWDPDERVGLGAQGQGTKYPLKPEAKHDTYGIGIKKRGSSAPPPAPPKKKLLDAKQASIAAEREKRARRKLQEYLFS